MARCQDCADFLAFGESVHGVIGVCQNVLNEDGWGPPEIDSRRAMDGCEYHTPKVTRCITCPGCGCKINVGITVASFEESKQ